LSERPEHRLEQIIRETAKEMHVEVLDHAVNPDHLHLCGWNRNNGMPTLERIRVEA
jgi:REP element-mobilizing transposase RayT